MDFLNKFAEQAGDDKKEQYKPQQKESGIFDQIGGLVGQEGNKGEGYPQQQQQSSGSSSSLLDKLHGAIGGGPESEKKEDALDKGIDWVQENILKQGAQNNEDAAEQAKDKLIANTIREQYKKQTGNDFPAKDKEEESSSGVAGLANKFGF
ncbi:hypothetical protein B0H67DRAFT_489603 [Lasiosphaeris hirsuta]|uniref:Uncharacterized protein n=1 Tax=Lasiosphaeris hirsuta TaxID=260670 RepID=A0AA40DTN9_9PEZI|nr:hypothetical protein B0H67DRAFT_489603 [Lasiosphaeris hirsuta]